MVYSALLKECGEDIQTSTSAEPAPFSPGSLPGQEARDDSTHTVENGDYCGFLTGISEVCQ